MIQNEGRVAAYPDHHPSRGCSPKTCSSSLSVGLGRLRAVLAHRSLKPRLCQELIPSRLPTACCMNVPKKADKWIVFVIILAVGIVDSLRSTPIERSVLPLMLAATFTISYVIWGALCRLMTRLFGKSLAVVSVRVFVNGVFLAFIMVAIFFPVPTVTVTIPAKISIKTSADRHPDTHSGHSVNDVTGSTLGAK